MLLEYEWPAAELSRYHAYMASSEPLWQPKPADPTDKEAHKAWLQAELAIFARAMTADRRRVALGRLDREALGKAGLKSIDRLHAYRLGHLEGLARYYSEHPGADTAPGLISLIIIASDNDEYGACYLSIPRMAEVLSRTKDSIREGIDRLVADGIIQVEERSGNSTLLWPVVHPIFATKVSLQSLVDVYSRPRAWGRPRNKPVRCEGEPLSEKLPGGAPEGFSKNPSPPRPKTPPPRARDDSPIDHPKKNSTAVPPGPADQSEPAFKKGKPQSRIVSNWQPSPADKAWVQCNYAATDLQIAQQAERFRDHHQAKGSQMADWAAAWRSWWGSGYHKIARRTAPSAPGGSGLMPEYWWRDNPSATRSIGDDGWRQLVTAYGSPAWQIAMLGPPPGTTGCVVPPDVVRKLNLNAGSTGAPR